MTQPEQMSRTRTTPRLAYRVVDPVSAGNRNAAPVLLVMGFGMPGAMWEPQVEGLSQRHRVACYDHRGIGQSDTLSGVCRIRDLAADARRLLDELGWERAHVVGVSMGGMVAQELALAAPERLLSLSLIATHAGGPLGIVPTLQGLKLFARANLLPVKERPKALVELLYPPAYRSQVKVELLSDRLQAGLRSRAEPRTLRAQLFAVVTHDTRRRLAKIRTPTLVVKPEQDLLVRPRHSELLLAGIPGAKLLSLPEGGHGCVFQCAERLNAALLEHFADNEPAEPSAAHP